MKEEMKQLKLRIREQEELLQESVERLQSTNRTKQNMEHFIVSQRELHPLCTVISLQSL